MGVVAPGEKKNIIIKIINTMKKFSVKFFVSQMQN